MVDIWWFPKNGITPNQPFLFGIVHEINHPATGVPPLLKPPCSNPRIDRRAGYLESIRRT